MNVNLTTLTYTEAYDLGMQDAFSDHVAQRRRPLRDGASAGVLGYVDGFDDGVQRRHAKLASNGYEACPICGSRDLAR